MNFHATTRVVSVWRMCAASLDVVLYPTIKNRERHEAAPRVYNHRDQDNVGSREAVSVHS